MESTALPFWEKLGLSCVSGPKEIAAFAIHCSNLPEFWRKDFLAWFTALEWTFKKTGLGNQVLAEDGLLALDSSQTLSIAQILANMALQTEQWTDTLVSLLTRFEGDLKSNKFVVLYAFVYFAQPSSMLIFSKLEEDLRRLAKSRWNVAPEFLNVRPFPWTAIRSSMGAIQGPAYDMRRLAMTVYDSLLVPMIPHQNRKSHLPNLESESISVVYPSFTISPIDHMTRSTTRFQLKWKADPFNLTDTGLLLHVGYHLGSSEGELSFVAIMDEKAQGHFVTGWRRSGSLQGEIERIWKQVQEYAKRARILWRIVVCIDRQMQIEEVKQWLSLLKQQEPSLRALDVTLACFDDFTPMILIPARSDILGRAGIGQPQARTSEDNKMMHYIDARQADYAVYPPFRVAMCKSESEEGDTLLPLASSATISLTNRYNGSVAVTSSHQNYAWPDSAPQHFWLHILQVYNNGTLSPNSHQDGISMRNRMQLITKSYHHLTFIARERFLLEDNLPWHLSILSIFRRASHMC